MTYASQFAAITLEQLQSMRDRCAMRTGVLADPIMLNILDQEIASRGPAVPDYPICDECDERHSVDVSCEDYTERAMQKATATESSTGPIRVFSDRELATVLHALRHRWAAFMTWAASQEAEDAISDFMLDVAPAAENILKCAAVLIALYFAIEIGSAFLHGGAVDRVLGGLR